MVKKSLRSGTIYVSSSLLVSCKPIFWLEMNLNGVDFNLATCTIVAMTSEKRTV